jgi:hypothetical protein
MQRRDSDTAVVAREQEPGDHLALVLDSIGPRRSNLQAIPQSSIGAVSHLDAAVNSSATSSDCQGSASGPGGACSIRRQTALSAPTRASESRIVWAVQLLHVTVLSDPYICPAALSGDTRSFLSPELSSRHTYTEQRGLQRAEPGAADPGSPQTLCNQQVEAVCWRTFRRLAMN